MSGETQIGRPRDAEAGTAIKSAALRMVRAMGYGKVSISRIAAEAGVARQTLYNRWPTKADLVLDAVFDQIAAHTPPPDPANPEPPEAQLRAFLTRVLTHLERDGDTLRALIAAAQDDPAFRDTLRERFVLPREALVTELLREAQRRGELSPGRDAEMLSTFIHGAFWYRLLNGQPIGAELAEAITAEIFAP